MLNFFKIKIYIPFSDILFSVKDLTDFFGVATVGISIEPSVEFNRLRSDRVTVTCK